MNDSARRIYYFALLTPHEKEAAILRMAKSGVSIHTIAAAAQLSFEMVRTIIANRAELKDDDQSAS